MNGLPWWAWLVLGYGIYTGISALHDREVTPWSLWVVPMGTLGFKVNGFVHHPWVMIGGGLVGCFIGTMYAQSVGLRWNMQHPNRMVVPGSPVMLGSFLLFFMVKGGLYWLSFKGMMSTVMLTPWSMGVGGVFAGYNGARAWNWTYRHWKRHRI